MEITCLLVWQEQKGMNHTVVWPLTCKGQLDVHPWANKPNFLWIELVLLSAQTSRTIILILDVLTLSDKFQSERDKGNKNPSAEVMRTYSDHPQGMQIYDENTADSSAAARVQTLCPQWFILKMVDALRL